jgi:RHS repeat-associated protein
LGIDEPLATTASGVTSYYHADGLGSITSLTNASGTVVNSYEYDSYGQLTSRNEAVSNTIGYTAREDDGQTGLYYYRARYYDPATGRFLSEDPVRWDSDDTNFYRYVLNRPVTYLDPTGLRIVVNPGSESPRDPYSPGLNITNYDVALGYLVRDPMLRQVLHDLMASPKTFTIVFVKDDRVKYYPDSRKITWNPYLAIRCSPSGRLSPALALGHELVHAWLHQGPVARALGSKPDPQYGTRLERLVIERYEAPAAQRLGESVRSNHEGYGAIVPTPLSR